MADSTVKIEITGEASGAVAAAGEATAGVNKLRDAAKDAVPAQHGLNDAEKEGASIAELLHHNHRLVHQILHLIGHEAGPEAGAALAALGFAGGGGVMLAAMAAKELFEWLHKSKEAADRLAEANAAMWQAQRDAVAQALIDNDDYVQSMAKMKAAKDADKAAEDAALTVLKAKAEQEKTILEYQEKQAKIALEKNKQSELSGAVGDDAKRAEIERRYAGLERKNEDLFTGKKSDQQLKSESDELAQQRQVLQQAEMDLAFAKRKADEAERQKESDNVATAPDEAQVKKWLDEHKDDIGKAQEAVDAAGNIDELTKQANAPVDPSLSDGGAALREIAAIQLARAKAAQAQLNQDKADYDNYTAASKRFEQHHKDLDDNLAKAKDAVQKYTDAVNDLTEKVKTGQTVLDIHRQTAAATGNPPPPDPNAPMTPTALPPAPGFERSPQGKAQADMRQLSAALDQLSTINGSLTDSQMMFVQRLLSIIDGHAVKVNQVKGELARIFSWQTETDAAYDRLVGYLQNVQTNAPTASGLSQ